MKQRFVLRRLAVVFIAAILAGCGSSPDYEKRQQYIDQCIIDAGPQSEKTIS